MSATTSTPQPWTAHIDLQDAPGEKITLKVTRPDGTAAADSSGVTDANGDASGSFLDTVPDQTAGTYSANFSIDADAKYQAESITKTFTIVPGLIARNLSATIGNSG